MRFSVFNSMAALVLLLASFSDAVPQDTSPAAPKIPGRQDFVTLQEFVKNFIKTTPRGFLHMIRASFHDLMNFNPAAGIGAVHGCLVDDPAMAAHKSNVGLTMAADLVKAVRAKCPSIAFSTGDILTLAGKVSVELAIPGITVAWEFGRRPCREFKPEVAGGPSPAFRTVKDFQPFLNRYGLTLKEMAVLTIGAHGLSGAENRKNESNIDSFTFARVSSGTEFIKTTLNPLGWQFFNNSGPTDRYALKLPPPNGPTSANNTGRFPSDMTFFPSIVKKSGATPDTDSLAAVTETQLKTYTLLPNSQFDRDFAIVFAKILRLGSSNLTPF